MRGSMAPVVHLAALTLVTGCIPVRLTMAVRPAVSGRVLTDGQGVAGARVIVEGVDGADTARTDSLGAFATPGRTRIQRVLWLLPIDRWVSWRLSVARDSASSVHATFGGMGGVPQKVQVTCELARDATLRCTR